MQDHAALVASPSAGNPFLMSELGSGGQALATVASGVRSHARGSFVYQQGTAASNFYQLVRGRIRIYISMPNGSERVLSYAEPGSTFGESACFDELPYYTTSVAVRPSEVRVFSRDAMLSAARERPEILHELFRTLVRKQRMLATLIVAESLSGRDRAILLINYLVEAYGERCGATEEVRLHLGLSIEELASIVGVSRVTLSRELSDMVRRGVLAKDRLDILVLDPAALKAEVNRLGV